MKKICIVLNKDKPEYSETFLQSHIDNLAFLVLNLHKYIPHVEAEVDSTDSYSFKSKVIKILNYPGYIRLKRILKSQRIEVVFAEYGHIGAMMTRICKDLNISLIVHFHGYDAYKKSLINRYSLLYKKMFETASKIIVVSKDMKKQVVKLGADPNKTHINPCGVDIDMFSKAEPKNSMPILLAVGRFVAKKAPYLTILAFQKIIDKIPEAKLIMIGDGELYEVCNQMVKSLNLENAIEIKKAVPHEKIAEFMQIARVFVQHSIVSANGDSEGTPVTILEAGASGLPVISTKHAGIKDVVIHGETGYLVDEGNIDLMSKYMYDLLANPSKAQKMGEQGKNFIFLNNNMRKSIDNIKKIVNSI